VDLPQQASTPVVRIAQAWAYPTATSLKDPLGAVACPRSFFPQQVIAAELPIAQDEDPPVETTGKRPAAEASPALITLKAPTRTSAARDWVRTVPIEGIWTV
jgi:hypothetical protein